MTAKTQTWCIWISVIGLTIIGIGFWPVAGYLPPPHANDSAQEIARFYRDDTDAIRLGLLMCFLGSVGWGTMVAVMYQQATRMNRRNGVLPTLVLLCGSLAWVFLTVPVLVLSVAAFRPDRNPDTTQTIHDLGWFLLFMPLVPFCAMNAAFAAAIFQDEGRIGVLPRWVAYFNLWAAVLFTPGGVLTFFKTGPFAYHGLMVYWVPLIVFFGWWALMLWVLRGAVQREAADVDVAQPEVPATA